MGNKQFSKLGKIFFFKNSNRNMTTRLSTIQLCAGKLETGVLKNPWVEPKLEINIFYWLT